MNKSVHPYDVRCVDKGIHFLPVTSFVSIDSLSSGSIVSLFLPCQLSAFPLSECECVGQVMHSPRNDSILFTFPSLELCLSFFCVPPGVICHGGLPKVRQDSSQRKCICISDFPTIFTVVVSTEDRYRKSLHGGERLSVQMLLTMLSIYNR